MKTHIAVISALLLTAVLVAPTLRAETPRPAEPRLELGVAVSPVFVHDDAWSLFSPSDNAMMQFSTDLRVRAVTFANTVSVLPLISFRTGQQRGHLWVDTVKLDTGIRIHDLSGGLRVRGWIRPWIGAFAQAELGASFIEMRAKQNNAHSNAQSRRYTDDKAKFLFAGWLGVEGRMPPEWLAQRGVRRFNLGLELAAGIVKRAETVFKATADYGDDLALAPRSPVNFGHIHLTGFALQFGINLFFF